MDRNSKPGSIRESFGDLLKSYNIESKYLGAKVKTDWERIMGKPIASRTTRIRLNKKKLTIYLTSAPLRNELNMSRSRVLELLKKEYGDGVIDEVIFI